MLLFGHTGITFGVALLLAGLAANLPSTRKREAVAVFSNPQSSSQPTEDSEPNEAHQAPWLEFLATHIDLRLLLVASLLPDIIDKPVGLLFFNNGRIFSHTLLFLVLISLIGICVYRRSGKVSFLVLPFGVFTHLILDEMWRSPQTLLWPVYGFAFERMEVVHYHWTPAMLYNMLYASLINPRVLIPELIGLAVVLWFARLLLRRKGVLAFIKYGGVV